MPMNETGGLASLVAALEGGMDPSQAFGIVQYLEQEQANRMAQRAERLGGLSSLLTNAAMSGMPYGGAEALAEAQPGPAGPAVQSMLTSLYPTAGDTAPAPSVSDFGAGLRGLPGAAAPGAELSPAYTQDPMAQMQMAQAETDLGTAQMQQQAMQQEMELQAQSQQAGMAQALAQFTVDARTAKEQGMTVGDFIRQVVAASPENTALLQSDPAAVRAVLVDAFEVDEVKSAPWHATLGV